MQIYNGSTGLQLIFVCKFVCLFFLKAGGRSNPPNPPGSASDACIEEISNINLVLPRV